MNNKIINACIALGLLATINGRADQNYYDSPAATGGAVFTIDNAASGNHVLAYRRSASGLLTSAGSFDTGGLGTGGGLGSQGSVVLSRNGDWLFVCDAGSDEVSVFSVQPTGLVLADKVSSGGKNPISIAVHQNLIYVLNAGGDVGATDNVTGFVFAFGKLLQGPDSSRSLSSSNTVPAEVSFTRDGNSLVITEKGTGLIDTFNVGDTGLLDNFKTTVSSVPTPYGFAVGREDRIFVSQANGGAANAGALSSYEISDDGDVYGISLSVPTAKTAPCWVVITRDQRYVYTTDNGSASIAGFSVTEKGKLNPLNANGITGTTDAGPIDLALSQSSQFLYSLNSGDNTISAFEVKPDGSLKALGKTTLPSAAVGLAAQ